MGTLVRLATRLLGRESLSLHDFGYFQFGERLAIAHGLWELANMRHLNQQLRHVTEFEQELERYFSGSRALGAASGTDALFFALQQAGVGPGTEVITVASTWITTITPVHELGACCRFVDVDPASGLMDLQALEQAITPATVAIMPVHMYGSMVPMAGVMEIAQRHGLKVIEDACQSIGASYQGRAAGTWGDAGCFSFFTTKLVGAPGDGGMLLTPHADWAQSLREKMTARWHQVFVSAQPRVPSRLSPLSIPFLRARLRALQRRVRQRQRQWLRYFEGVSELPAGSATYLLQAPAGVASSFRNCILVSPHKSQIMTDCRQAGLPVEEVYTQSKEFIVRLGVQGVSLPNALHIASYSLSLPLGAQMTDRNIDRVLDIITRNN